MLEEEASPRGLVREKTALATYLSRTRKSARMYSRAREIFVGGQSHNARFFEPYPFYAIRARGRHIWDMDGNKYTDYWMGHTALILGHSPKVVSEALNGQTKNGLLFGAPNRLAYELGELVTKTVPCAELIRFCTTGAEATMYAVRLARAYTKRKVVVKIEGGWHGFSSTLAIGVSPPYDIPESAGLVPEDELYSRLIQFNNIEDARKVLSQESDAIAAVILEPVMGAGGSIPADKEFLTFLREECERIGCVLIFDEIITGFRIALGGAQEFYNMKPDLCTLGKILGGGLPVSAIVGREDIMGLADNTTRKEKSERCWIGGGTFSEGALSMAAGIATLKHLIRNKQSIYETLGSMGEELRMKVDAIFSERRIRTRTTGLGSLFATHFLSPGQVDIRSPKDVNDSLQELAKKYYFTMIAKYGIYFIPGHIGAISTAHRRSDLKNFVRSTQSIANSLDFANVGRP